MWNCAEDADKNDGKDEGAKDRLKKDGVLDLTQSGLLNPDFTVKDLADDVALFVSRNPWLIFVAVAVRADESLLRHSSLFHCRQLLIIDEKLPGTKVTVVHSVEDNTHALPRSNQGRDANEETNESQASPATTSAAKSDEKAGHEAGNNAADTETTGKDDARSVAVANGPANKVGVGLTAQGVFDGSNGRAKGRWVGCDLERAKDSSAFTVREIELAGTVHGNVDGNDAADFLTEWLGGD